MDVSYSTRSLFEGSQWLAPEFLSPKRIQERGSQGDIFSFGVIAWELITGQVPWENMMYLDVIQVVLKGERLPIPEKCPEKFKELLHKCWLEGKSLVIAVFLTLRS